MPNFVSFYNYWALAHGALKNQWAQLWESQEVERTLSPPDPLKKHNKQLVDIQHLSSSLKGAWGIWEEESFTHLRECLEA